MLVTEHDLMQLKREEQRRKTRERMARYRMRLKESSPEEQEAARERAKAARDKYRASHRLELRESSECWRAHRFIAQHGMAAYQAKIRAKLQKDYEKRLISEGRRRRAVRPRASKGAKKAPRRSQAQDSGDDTLGDGEEGSGDDDDDELEDEDDCFP